MACDLTKLDDLEMLSLLALGLTAYMKRVAAGEKDPFPLPRCPVVWFQPIAPYLRFT